MIQFNSKKYFALSSLFLSSVISLSAFGWADHHLITQEALKKTPVANLTVEFQSFDKVLKVLNLNSSLEFNQNLKIHKNYRFNSRMHEAENLDFKVIEVLAKYSDEPDWGMDQELFAEDQYPELWKDEYSMMGGSSGLSSQAFRHMYWRSLYWKHPVESFKLPFKKIKESMGEAPQRAAAFMELAKVCFANKLDYWGWRFTANALHYMEDVTQPFHAAQVPSKIMISKILGQCFSQFKCDQFIQRMTNIIAYYHFAYEDVIAEIFKSQKQRDVQFDFVAALNGKTSNKYLNQSPLQITEQLAKLSNQFSARAGQSSLKFFPEYQGAYLELDADKFMDEAWWKTVEQKLAQAQVNQDPYLKTVDAMFLELGDAIRSWVEAIKVP
jgi:hypothetical protein